MLSIWTDNSYTYTTICFGKPVYIIYHIIQSRHGTTSGFSWDFWSTFWCRKRRQGDETFLSPKQASTTRTDRLIEQRGQDSNHLWELRDRYGHCCRHGGELEYFLLWMSPLENQKDIFHQTWIGGGTSRLDIACSEGLPCWLAKLLDFRQTQFFQLGEGRQGILP